MSKPDRLYGRPGDEYLQASVDDLLEILNAEVIAEAWIAENPAKALRALLTDECDCEDGLIWREVPCDEHDHDPPLPANTSCTMLMQKQVRHEVCGGRGWLPKDGVEQLVSREGDVWFYRIPADWLEGRR